MDIIDLKDGPATPKFWVLVNLTYHNSLSLHNLSPSHNLLHTLTAIFLVSGASVSTLVPGIQVRSIKFTDLSSPSSDLICLIYPGQYPLIEDITPEDLLKTICFDNEFLLSKRKTAYFGSLDYSYSNTFHKMHRISSNPLIKHCVDTLNTIFPGAMINSVLINYYPDATALIPFHSDNEPSICPTSLTP